MPDHIAALVNGEQVDHLPVTDRGLQFGDGLFETIAVRDGQPVWLNPHLARLIDGCQRLKFSILPDTETLRQEASDLCRDHKEAVLKIIVTRGNSTQGYSAAQAMNPNRIMILKTDMRHAPDTAREGIQLGICRQPLAINPALAGIKHLNRLEQVLARIECEAQWQEGLMLDTNGFVIEGTMSNLFLIRDGILITPSLERTGINGITRDAILEIANKNDIVCQVRDVLPEELNDIEEMFVCNSLIGIWPVVQLDDLHLSIGAVTRKLQQLLAEAMC
jgi:4-amino-4-deoxychorismate lyase